MLNKEEVGRRIKLARFRRDMTLKEVATKSGMSATHISEIERGKTSPTIGALQRIASALDERPAHFVEDVVAAYASLVTRADRVKCFVLDGEGVTTSCDSLTADPPWATARVLRMSFKPGERTVRPPEHAEMFALSLGGMIRITIQSESNVLREGDTMQFSLADGLELTNIGEDDARILVVIAYMQKGAW